MPFLQNAAVHEFQTACKRLLEVPWDGCLQFQQHCLLAVDFLVLSTTQPLYIVGKLGNESQTPLRSAGCRVALFTCSE